MYNRYILPRSGLASKGVCVSGGVIDEDYRGHVMVMLYGIGNTHIVIKKCSVFSVVCVALFGLSLPSYPLGIGSFVSSSSESGI